MRKQLLKCKLLLAYLSNKNKLVILSPIVGEGQCGIVMGF